MIMHMFYNDTLGKLVLRLTVGGLMLFHGIGKLSNTSSLELIGGRLIEHGLPGFIAYGVYLGEVLAPLMLIAGIYSRYGAGLIMINMLFAIGLVHMADIFALNPRGGSWRLELQGFYLFGAIAVMFLGSGRLALKPD